MDRSAGRCRQARSRGGNPAAHTPSATVRELCQSRLVLGLLRLGERLPALAWGMARGTGERAREEGLKRSVTGRDRGREGKHVELGTGACGAGKVAVVARAQGQGQG